MYQSTQPFVPAFEWQNLVERGDVVLFRYPLADEYDASTDTRPKRRPCLVLDVFSNGGTCFIELAYGTSAPTNANRGYEVRVGKMASCYAAGLKRPSRFVCARRIIVSVNHSGFDDDDNSGTLIGRLDPPLTERMNAVQARLQADADTRAAAQQERREEQAR